MAYFEVPENLDYNDKIEKLTPETRGHADVWNVIYERIIQNIAYIYNAVNVLNGSGDGSVSKLIKEEVAKIIADAPEDFDTLKEISDWISEHQDGAAAMNTAITDLKNTKLDKTDTAGSAAIANSFKVPRVDTDVNTIPGVFTGTVKEQMNTSANLPTSAHYHILTLEGGDAGYATQLAIGMTTMAVYYRNRQGGTWGTWKEIPLLTGNLLDKRIILPSYLRVGTNSGTGIELRHDGEGGNIRIFSPESNGAYYEIDALGGNLRIYYGNNKSENTASMLLTSDGVLSATGGFKGPKGTISDYLEVGSYIRPLTNMNTNENNLPTIGTDLSHFRAGYFSHTNTSELVIKNDMVDGISKAFIYYTTFQTLMYQSGKTTGDYQQGLSIHAPNDNIHLQGERIFLHGTTSVSANSFAYSDCKVKKFSDDIGEDKDKLLELFDFIQVRSYKYKYANNDKLDIGISAQELRAVMDDLGIDIDKYNILDIYYNYMLPRGNGEEDMKYYTEFYTISYNCLYNLSLMKIKRLEEKYNRLESDIELLKRKVGA